MAATTTTSSASPAVTEFGLDKEGNPVHRVSFTSPNGLLRASMITYGATLQSFQQRSDSSSNDWAELVLGYDCMSPASPDDEKSSTGYLRSAGHLGATCGRFANRIGNARFPQALLQQRPHNHVDDDNNNNNKHEQQGKEVSGDVVLPINNNNKHTLHGGPSGYSLKTWNHFEVMYAPSAAGGGASAASSCADGEKRSTVIGVAMFLHSPDLDNGFPGALDITAKYYFAPDSSFMIELMATNVAPRAGAAAVPGATVVNLTNHAYWRLNPHSPTILNHFLEAPNATFYVPVADGFAIPTGEIRSVKNTALDFTAGPTRIGERIDDPILIPGPESSWVKRGYDNCLLLSGAGVPVGAMRHAATLSDPESGRFMSVETTCPAVQIYSGNFLLDNLRRGYGDDPANLFGCRAGLCLETQFLPDSPNKPHFPSTVVQPGQTWHHVTRHRFGITAKK